LNGFDRLLVPDGCQILHDFSYADIANIKCEMSAHSSDEHSPITNAARVTAPFSGPALGDVEIFNIDVPTIGLLQSWQWMAGGIVVG
jgi:hypothetical protein